MKKGLLTLLVCCTMLAMSCAALNTPVPTSPASDTLLEKPVEPADAAAEEPTIDAGMNVIPTESPHQAKPRSLYFLTDKSIWGMRGGASESIRLTPQDTAVTAFDVWPADGRLAFATESGQLIANLPDEDPKLLFELPGSSPLPAFISSIDWSPRGDSLAFSVDFDGQGNGIYLGYPSYPSGIWTINISDLQATWLHSNRYLQSTSDNVNNLLVLHEPVWSPDQLSLMLDGGYWEWSNVNVLFPLTYAEDARFLTEVKTSPTGDIEGWMNGAWMPDGKGILLSGKMYSAFGSLAYYDLTNNQARTIIDGEKAGLYIYDAYPVPDDSYLPGDIAGIHAGPNRFVFLANCATCSEGSPARLYVAAFVDGYLQSQAVGPEKLCSLTDSFGNANDARIIKWTPDFAGGVLICGANEIYLLDMRQESLILTDLIPFLPSILENEVPRFKWGAN